MKRIASAAGAAALAAGLSMSAPVKAVSVERESSSHGTASCQSALPVFDGNIRKRPLALANEGTGNAFITCDTEASDLGGSGFWQVRINFYNRGAATAFNCTLVDGISPLATYFPDSLHIPTNAAGIIGWNTADNGGENFDYPAISCSLPPGGEIIFVQFYYLEEIGA